uniref:Uncharacterized protein n=1 Tax=Aegilops tauschii TaxID=37682 RepID=R7W3R4_AEGTA
MLRSLLLLPRLSRHGSQLCRRAYQITSRGYYTSSEDETDFEDIDHPDAKPADHYQYGCAWPSDARRHLYLVLDDWKKGFSIYKLDLDSDGNDGRRDLTLPAPVHRQENRHVTGRPWNFATLGSKIVAAGAQDSDSTHSFDSEDDAITLIYDTETAGGHYDDELEAWVGLHKIFHHPQQLTDGYLSSCDVASLDGCPAQLAWNLCTERLFDPDDDWHIGASLVYMGDNIYCLVELVAHERFKKRRRLCVGHKCAVRLTIFRLRYGKNGELTITARRPDHTYLFPRFGNNTGVRAFWM